MPAAGRAVIRIPSYAGATDDIDTLVRICIDSRETGLDFKLAVPIGL